MKTVGKMISEIDLIAPFANRYRLVRKNWETIAVDNNSFSKEENPSELIFEATDVVYLFVVDGVILKIGQTSKTMAKRIDMYNAGRKNGKTEQRLLDYLMSTKKKVYLYVVSASQGEILFQGKRQTTTSRQVEQFLIKEYVNHFGRLPLSNESDY